MTPTNQFLVVCEGPSDWRVAAILSKRVLAEFGEWVEPALRGDRDADDYLQWASLRDRDDVPRRKGFKPDGWGPDSEVARRALHVAEQKLQDIDGVILLRDADQGDASEKCTALASAVKAAQLDLPVAVGIASAKIEAWLLAGLSPDTAKRAEVRQTLGFDAITQAHELRAADEQAKSNAKRVLALFATLPEAFEQLETIDLAVLRVNGARTGLPHFLRQLRCQLGRAVSNHVPPLDWCDCAAEVEQGCSGVEEEP